MLNDFAIRSFRDVADGDYISARQAYRAQLVQQFQWASLQAIEKYLKCVLLLNRIHARDLRHDLSKALERAEKKLPFPLRLSEKTRDFILHLDTYGRHRYFETPYSNQGLDIVRLDRAVWEIRRYCHVINYSITDPNGKEISVLPLNLNRIEKAESEPWQDFKLFTGYLETVLKSKKHPARESLVWKNLRFGKAHRHKVRLAPYLYSANSPLALHPEILDEVLRYVYLPRDVVDAYRQDLKEINTS